MNNNFHIAIKKRNGNLHIIPRGDFDGSSAWQLIKVLGEQYDNKGYVFIDTKRLRTVYPFGCRTFQCHFSLSRVPADRLFFEGEKGYDIAPRGSTVRMPRKSKCRCCCDGDCTQCPFGKPSRNRKRL